MSHYEKILIKRLPINYCAACKSQLLAGFDNNCERFSHISAIVNSAVSVMRRAQYYCNYTYPCAIWLHIKQLVIIGTFTAVKCRVCGLHMLVHTAANYSLGRNANVPSQGERIWISYMLNCNHNCLDSIFTCSDIHLMCRIMQSLSVYNLNSSVHVCLQQVVHMLLNE